MIYDCFTYAGEIDVLDIRMNELKPLGVTHVLVQSFETFSGNQKKCTYFDRSKNKDLVVNILYGLPNGTAWEREEFQRNAIMESLTGANDDDIVIISDVDEIPSVDAVSSYKIEMGLTALLMNNYWYKFNFLTEKRKWVAPKIMTYGYLKSTTPNAVRNSGYESTIENGGWHFSYLGDADYIVNKIESFSHQEYNTTQYKDKDEITRKIENGLSLWGESKFEKVDIDDTFPSYLKNNKEKFKHLIA